MTSRSLPGTPGLLDLPVEVRHVIYRHLFCHRPNPISLGPRYLEPTFEAPEQPDDDASDEPTFHVGLFRVNKAISRDALQFAYSGNSFQLMPDLRTFCGLGTTALASIKTLTVFNNCCSSSGHSRLVWKLLTEECTSLELLILQPSSHLFLRAIPYFKDFVTSISHDQIPPRLVVHLYIWDRHFSFDLPDRDYHRTLQDLSGRLKDDLYDDFMSPKELVMSMPRHVKQIELVLDVSPGAVRALDAFLQQSPDLHLTKLSGPVPYDGHRVGRQIRHCYVWDESTI